MPGAIPAPAPRPKIGWQGQPAVSIPPAGLIIVPGTGVVGRTDPVTGKLLLDASRISAPEEFSLYKSTVAVGTVGVWQNLRPSGQALCVGVEVNLETAPTSGDGANFYAVRVSDGAGANGLLPISSAGVKHYILNKGDGVDIAQFRRPADVNLVASPFRATLQKIVTSQNLTVTAVTVPCAPLSGRNAGSTDPGSTATGNAVFYPGSVRAVLLDAAGTILADSGPVYGGTYGADMLSATAANNNRRFVFPQSVTLTSGVTYYLGMALVDNPPAGRNYTSTNDSNAPRLARATGQADTAAQPLSLVETGKMRSWGATIGFAAGGTPDWTQAVAGTGGWSALALGGTADDRPIFTVVGSGGAVALVGDVTVSLELTGAVASPGAGLNVRALFALGT